MHGLAGAEPSDQGNGRHSLPQVSCGTRRSRLTVLQKESGFGAKKTTDQFSFGVSVILRSVSDEGSYLKMTRFFGRFTHSE